MTAPTRENAWALLTEFTASQALRRHALAVEAAMRALARSAGVTDETEVELWGLVGLLHDFDYEKYPTEADHVFRGMEILRQRGWPEDLIRAVGGHAFYTGIPRETPMEKAILAADELTQALSLSWRELSKITPWGDKYDALAPGGDEVEVERNYLWFRDEGGDVLIEVTARVGEREAQAFGVVRKDAAEA